MNSDPVPTQPARSGSPRVPDAAPAGDGAERGINPFSTGGGGVAFAYRVATDFLASMLTGGRRTELDGEVVTRVSFQTGPGHRVDDLLVEGERHSVAVACRATPSFVPGDAPTVTLVKSLLDELAQHPSATHRVAVAAAGDKPQWGEVAELSDIAANHADTASFVATMSVPGRTRADLRRRYQRLRDMVEKATADVDDSQVVEVGQNSGRGTGDGAGAGDASRSPVAAHDVADTDTDTDTGTDAGGPVADDIDRLTFGLLGRLRLLPLHLQGPRPQDWVRIGTELDRVAAPDTDGSRLRDRLAVLASGYDPAGAVVDRSMLRNDTHGLLQLAATRTQAVWHALDVHRGYARAAVRRAVGPDDESGRSFSLLFEERSDRLAGLLGAVGTTAGTLLVTGDSGVGKSSLVLSTVDRLQAQATVDSVVVNLRQLPDTTIELETHLGASLRDALSELAGPSQLLVVDAADVVLERSTGLLGDLLTAATETGVGVVLVCSDTARDLLAQLVTDRRSHRHESHTVAPLDDSELAVVAAQYPSLAGLLRGLPTASLLRRLVVLDLLARTGRTLTGQVDEWDCLHIIWDGLVLNAGDTSSGSPEARSRTLLALAGAALAATPTSAASVASALTEAHIALDSAAVDSLRRDHLLAPHSVYRPRPDFAHDELRRYATAVLLVRETSISARLEQSDVPRWSLSAATLACKGQLHDPDKRPVETFLILVAEFHALAASHGPRWADIPVEAALETPFAYDCLRAALDGPPAGTTPGPSSVGTAATTAEAHTVLELDNVLRIVQQRLYRENRLDLEQAAPVVRYLTGHPTPWRISDSATELLDDWLRGHTLAATPTGHPIRVGLRERLLDHWAAHPAAASQPRSGGQASLGGRRRRRERLLSSEVTGRRFVTTLALLAHDTDAGVEAALRVLADLAPDQLAPAADSPYAAAGLAAHDPLLLADLVLAYYIDDTPHDGWSSREHSIREHRGLGPGLGYPLHAHWNGGFSALFNTAPLEVSANVLNALTNHAARGRVAQLQQHTRNFSDAADTSTFSYTLDLTGLPVDYVGDDHVWRWYRGTAVGPYPCLSALAAMERAAQTMLDRGMTVDVLTQTLLTGCENLAVPGMLFGVLVRNIETVGDTIDPFLAEPDVWNLETRRVTHEYTGLKASTDHLANPERRNWTLKEVVLTSVLAGDDDRRTELRAVAERLRDKGRGRSDADLVNDWSANLDYDRYVFTPVDGGTRVTIDEPPHPSPVTDAEAESYARINTILGIELQYRRPVRPGSDRHVPTAADVAADLDTVATLVDATTGFGPFDPRQAVMLVVKAAVVLAGDGQPSALGHHTADAVQAVIDVAGSFADVSDQRHDDTHWDAGPDRSAATALPVLLTAPLAAALAEAGATRAEVAAAGQALAQNAPMETRLFLAQGCDRVWREPCTGTPCIHAVAVDWLQETARDGEIGPWDNDRQAETDTRIDGDVTTHLEQLDGASVRISALDALIRGLGAAADDQHCQSERTLGLLTRALAVQSAAMVRHEEEDWNADWQGRHTAVAARALLQASAGGTSTTTLLEYLDIVSADAELLTNTLHGLAGAGAETPTLAEAARTVWPVVFRHVLTFADTRPDVLTDRRRGDWLLSALLPTPLAWGQRLYSEPERDPIDWVDATTLVDCIDQWLLHAQGAARCADALAEFLKRLPLDLQARRGLGWVEEVRMLDTTVAVVDARACDDWLAAIKTTAEDNGMNTRWQVLVDALVAAGNRALAEHST